MWVNIPVPWIRHGFLKGDVQDCKKVVEFKIWWCFWCWHFFKCKTYVFVILLFLLISPVSAKSSGILLFLGSLGLVADLEPRSVGMSKCLRTPPTPPFHFPRPATRCRIPQGFMSFHDGDVCFMIVSPQSTPSPLGCSHLHNEANGMYLLPRRPINAASVSDFSKLGSALIRKNHPRGDLCFFGG